MATCRDRGQVETRRVIHWASLPAPLCSRHVWPGSPLFRRKRDQARLSIPPHRPTPNFLSRGQLRTPDDLRRPGDAKDLDEVDHLVEQVSVSIVLAPFSQDDHGDKARSDLLNPSGRIPRRHLLWPSGDIAVKMTVNAGVLDRLRPETLMRG
jgi:hypothetical protein